MKNKYLSPIKLFLLRIFIFYILLMFLLRVVLYFFFKINIGDQSILHVFYLGFRFDLRHILIPVFITFLISLFANASTFKWAKKIILSIWLLFSLIFIVSYSSDFMHYSYLSQRLNASVLNYFQDVSISVNMVWQTYPIIKIMFLVVGFVVIMFFISKSILNRALKCRKPIKRVNIPIGILFFLLCAIGKFGRVGQYPLRWSDVFSLGNDNASHLPLNPFQ